MDAVIHHAQPLRGTLTVPPDKAICHRAVLVAAVARGQTEIRPWPSADDCQRTLEVVERLGISVIRSGSSVRVTGSGGEALRPIRDELFCGESGTTFRLVAGLLAGQPVRTILSAAPSLSQRPMRRIVEPLTQMGAQLAGAQRPGSPDVYPPLTVQGRRPLRAIRYTLPVASAQVKSAILLAALVADGRTTVVEPSPTRDHTERMLRYFQVPVGCEGAACSLEPAIPVSPGALELPGDFSSAAFFLVAAACVPDSHLTLQQVSVNPTRTALLGLLERLGARVRTAVEGAAWEPRGTVTVEARPLRGIVVEPREIPSVIDELPALMVAAACAEGTTRLIGVGELRVKETDRVRSMVSGLERLGCRVRLSPPDTVDIEGGPLRGAVVESAGDHRTAMSLAVAALAARGTTTIQGAECVSKSFPDFFERLARLAVGGVVTSPH